MAVSREQVIAAYHAIHEREPENEEVIEELRKGSPSLEHLLKELLTSGEFSSKMQSIYNSHAATEPSKYSLSGGEPGEWAEAARLCREAVDQDPGNSAAWARYGQALTEQGQLESAEEAYKQALKLNDKVADTHVRLGDILRRRDMHAEADRAYIAAFRLDPDCRSAAERLRTLPPEVASAAFRIGAPGSARHDDEMAPTRLPERSKFLRAAGLPSRVAHRAHPSPTPSQSKRPRFFRQTARGLALIATCNFLPFARLAAQSFLAHHRDFKVFLLLIDGDAKDAAHFDEGHVVFLRDLDVAHAGWFAAKFTASELSNAMKPSFLRYLSSFVERVIYLDSDIAVFSRLTELIELMDAHDIVLIPHMLTPLPRPEHFHTHPNRTDIFNSGLINAGCFAANLKNTQEFLEHWEDSLLSPGVFFVEAGYQTDQQYLHWALLK
jgi:tetratricopeptide (TPR) repeat protein